MEDVFQDLAEYIPNLKYYVCNQDEPYAADVIELILEGEGEKEAIKKYKSEGHTLHCVQRIVWGDDMNDDASVICGRWEKENEICKN